MSIIQELLKRGLPFNVENVHGEHPIHLAAGAQGPNDDIQHVEVLLEAGVNIKKARTNEGCTAAHYAAKSGHVEVDVFDVTFSNSCYWSFDAILWLILSNISILRLYAYFLTQSARSPKQNWMKSFVGTLSIWEILFSNWLPSHVAGMSRFKMDITSFYLSSDWSRMKYSGMLHPQICPWLQEKGNTDCRPYHGC